MSTNESPLVMKLAELSFATGTSCRDRIDSSLTKIRAALYSFAYACREAIDFEAAEQIVSMAIMETYELESAAATLCEGLDELIPDDSYADWVEEHRSLAEMGWTRETVIKLRNG